MTRCCILVPSRSGVDIACQQGLHELASRGYHIRYMHGATSIDQIRCQMATDAWANDYSEMFWIDDDIVFNPDDVDLLRTYNLPIVGGVYTKKGDPQLAIRWLEGTKSVTLGQGGGPVEVEYAATGFLLVRREVISRLAMDVGMAIGQSGRPMIPCFMPMIRERQRAGQDPERLYLSEDWAFFERARLAGYPIWVDTRPKLKHVGRYAYSWDDLAPRPSFGGIDVTIE